MSHILVVEDDPGLREALVDTLELADYRCTACANGAEALLLMKQQEQQQTPGFALVVSDVAMPQVDGLQLLRSVRKSDARLPFLLITANATVDAAVQAMREGASDYLAKPFAPQVLLSLVERYAPPQNVTADQQPVAGDAGSIELLALAQRVAQTDASVMVLGPSGSGKEVLARYIHSQSPRSAQPFVAINCAAIPESMLEATLFGYEKGAFTGALNACPGKFEQAQGGTLLLDEITEMDLALQAKLLRVLQEREVERLGGRKLISLDVRVLATSNRDLRQAVDDGYFREDLYYRLNVFPLSWKPLAGRPGDILPLAEHLLAQHSQKSGRATPALSAEVQQRLLTHHWPGNVRELDNVIQRALILCAGSEITMRDLMLDSELTDDRPHSEPAGSAPSTAIPANNAANELKQQEFQVILRALNDCQGKRQQVASQLGISPRTLRYKLAKMRELGYQLPA